MLRISYSEIKIKKRTILDENTLSLPVGKGVLISGEHNVISSLFAHILYQKCIFSLDEEVVERALFNHNISIVSSEGVLPLNMKVSDIFLDAGISHEQCQNALREIVLEDTLNKRIYQLSKEKRILLSLQLACVSKPTLLLVEGDWQKLSISCQEQLTKLLQKHVMNARFLLISQGASQLIQCDTQYEIVGQTLVSKQSSVVNFLEEKGVIEEKQNIKQKRMNFKKIPSLLGVVGRSLFYILSILFVCTTLMATIAMSATIQHMNGIVQSSKERGEYRMELKNCTNSLTENEYYCSGTKLTSEQKTILQDIEQIDQLYPVHKSNFAHQQGIIQKRAKLFRNGEEIIIDEEERSPFYTAIYSYDIAMTQLDPAKKGQRGIYISRAIKEEYKDFIDVEEGKLSIEVLVDVPIYIMSRDAQVNTQLDDEYTTVMKSDFHISGILPITLPILGVIEGVNENWYIEDTVFFAMQEEARLQSTEEFNGYSDPDAVITDYEPFQYNANVKTYEDLISVKAQIREQDDTIQVGNDILYQEYYMQELQNQQSQMRTFLLPIISVLGVLLLVLLTLSYKFQKDACIFAFQRQNIGRKWKRKQVGKSLLVSTVIMMLTISTTYLLSTESFQAFVLNTLSNQATIANVDLYNSMIYQIMTGILQALPAFLNLKGVAILLVIAIVIGILRYLPTWYFYFKARKLL